jgi:hypothetical protein
MILRVGQRNGVRGTPLWTAADPQGVIGLPCAKIYPLPVASDFAPCYTCKVGKLFFSHCAKKGWISGESTGKKSTPFRILCGGSSEKRMPKYKMEV